MLKKNLKNAKNAKEIIIPEGTSLKLYFLLTGQQNDPTNLRITIKKDAYCELFMVVFDMKTSGINIETILNEEHGSLKQHIAFIAGTGADFRISSNTILSAANTSALIQTNGILTGTAKAHFDGNIHITKDAAGANADLKSHALLLSPDAHMNGRPGLKIETSNARASHSSSITHIDDRQKFYGLSRGLKEKETEQMIAAGFLEKLFTHADQKDVPLGHTNLLGRPCLGTASGLSLTSLRLGLQEKLCQSAQ